MPPTGFGGGPPGLSILRGAAQGNVDRQKRESELQRRAIMNRLTEAQAGLTEARQSRIPALNELTAARTDQTRTSTDATRQSMEHAAKDQAFEEWKREQAQKAAQGSAPVLRQMLIERGYPPSMAESMTAGAIENILSAERTVAATEGSEAQAGAARVRAARNRSDIEEQERQRRVSEGTMALLSDPGFVRSAGNPDVLNNFERDMMIEFARNRAENAGMDVPDESIVRAVTTMEKLASQDPRLLMEQLGMGRLSAEEREAVEQTAETVRRKFADPEAEMLSRLQEAHARAQQRGVPMTDELRATMLVAEELGVDTDQFDPTRRSGLQFRAGGGAGPYPGRETSGLEDTGGEQ